MDKEKIIQRLTGTMPFDRLPRQFLGEIADRAVVRTARAGEVLHEAGVREQCYVILLEGELEVHMHTVGTSDQGALVMGRTGFGTNEGGMALLNALPLRATISACRDSRILCLDGDLLDDFLAGSPAFLSRLNEDTELYERVRLFRMAKPLRQLPFERFEVLLEKMQPEPVRADQTVIQQGDKGEYFYLVEQGEAEVWRTDPMTDETDCVAVLGRGETFGEEALVMNGFRNATVKMRGDGRLWKLDQTGFDDLLRGYLVKEITPEEAKASVDAGQADWLDCRYDLEYDEAHIPGARWIPLDTIRQQSDGLDKNRLYIVYCRSGRRSASAAFLLRERGFKAISMAGGVKAWPFALEETRVG